MENLTPETRLEYYLDKIAAGGGSSGGGGIFKVTVTGEEDPQYGTTTYTLDKNYTEITTAFNNGMLPIFIETEAEGDFYACNISYLNAYGATSEYVVQIKALSNTNSERTFYASEPTGVLRTQTDT